MSARKFTLHRIAPDGHDAPVPGVTLAKCRMYVSMSLVYNGHEDRKSAEVYVRQVAPGVTVEHPSGRSYWIEGAS